MSTPRIILPEGREEEPDARPGPITCAPTHASLKPGDPVWWTDETGEYHGFIHSLEPASVTGEPIANVKLGEGRFKTRLLKNLNHDPNLQPIEDNGNPLSQPA